MTHNIRLFGAFRRAARPCSAVAGVIAIVAAVLPFTAAGASLPASAATRAPAAADQPFEGEATAVHMLRPGTNPANPNCNQGVESPFSGGTGAFYSNQFVSDYVTAPFTGAADVPNADFTNIFLYPDSATMTWDQFMATLPPDEQGPSQEQINAMTMALVCSSYFDSLSQYNINPPSFSGDEKTITSCVNAALTSAKSTKTVISYATLRTFAGCEQSNNGNASSQVNIFSATGIEVSGYGQDGTDLCVGHTASGYHGWGYTVPNFAIIPTNPLCNANAGAVMDTLSHEMVEMVSDPGGLGWLHKEGIFNFWQNYDQGELADICSGVGAYPTPASDPGSIPFPTTFPLPTTGTLASLGLTDLSVAPYWSDQDDRCEPTSIMNDVLVPLAGSPSIRFTGTVHTLAIPISQSSPPAGVLDQLELDVVTGDDNLNSSSAANVIVQADVGGHTITMQQNDVNEGAEWANDSFHAVYLDFPPGIPVSDITQITINTQFSSGLFGDNWDVSGVMIQADVISSTSSCAVTSVTLLNVTGTTRLTDGSTGLVRMVGGAPQAFPELLSSVASDEQDLLVTGLYLTVGTGDDDLRGGNVATDNANAVLGLAGGASTEFANINNDANWKNNSTSPQIDLVGLNSLPPGTTAGDLQSLTLQTDLPGGLFGDNWDVSSLQLSAVLGCASTSAPTTVTQTLVDDVGKVMLTDGSTGLCRLTGSVHNCTVTIPPSGLAPSDVVDSMQITVTTGDDDLRGGGFAGDNADVAVGGQKFLNVNDFQDWPDGSVNSIPLVIPFGATVTLGKLTTLEVSTTFGGGLGGDNWDIADISLQATVTVPSMGRNRHTVERPLSLKANPPVAFSAAGASRPAAPNRAPSPDQAMGPSPWLPVASPSPSPTDDVLNGVTCSSSSECVAVGYQEGAGGVPQALIETGTGINWVVTPSPATGAQYSVLMGVSCVGAEYCVAVGYDGSGGVEGEGGLAQTLIETWNGSAWSVTVSGNPTGDTVSVLNSVSCVAKNYYCVAAGYEETTGDAQTLVEVSQDQSTAWKVKASADSNSGDSILNGVSCTSPTYCVAVGESDGSDVAQTLVESWNGSVWAGVASGNQGGGGNSFYGMGDNVLYAVSCAGPADCVAVGTYINNSRVPQTLVEQSSSQGEPWSVAPSDNPGSGGNVLDGVSCNLVTGCVSVGFDDNGTTDDTLNENWNGSQWFDTAIPSPGPVSNFLSADWCTSPVTCVGVGDDGDGSGMNQTLILDFVATPPNEPTAVTAVAGDTQAQVSFTAPSDNGGSLITSYTVTATDATNAANGGQIVSGASSPLIVTGLTNGDSYTFTVTATNGIGTGPASSPSNAVVPAVPVSVTGVSPGALGRGVTKKALTISGTGFLSGAKVTVSGSGVTLKDVSVVNDDTIDAKATVSVLAATGARSVTVADATGSATCTGCLTVDAAPTVTGASPPEEAAGAKGVIAVTGTGFENGAVLRFAGVSFKVTKVTVTPTSLTATVSVPSSSTVGAYTMTVTNPDGGAGSCAGCFSVIAPPTLTKLTPPSVGAGTSTSVTLTGTGFSTGAKVSGPAGVKFKTVKVKSSTTITATLSVAATTPGGTGLPVTVTNSASGGYGKVTADLLTITSEAPR
jgi:hypothetical protein